VTIVPPETAEMARRRRRLTPPPGLVDPVSRAQAAELLGYPSVFRIRELERQGRLTATRGVMGSAWYPRREILMLRRQEDAPPTPPGQRRAEPGRRRTDAELIADLRGADRGGHPAGVAGGPPTVADLVADTGVSIARAQKVYRFWLAHDAHPMAEQARTGRRLPAGPLSDPVVPGASREAARPQRANVAERRSDARLQRGTLIRQLRAADPALRAAAFAALKNARPPADVP
jgi:hypothetical protein